MNKATVLVVLILVSVAFSAPVLANGYEESHEHAEYDSQPDGWLDTGTEESRTEHDGRVGHEGHVGHGGVPPGQEEVITPPAVPVTPPTPAEEPLIDEKLAAAIITAIILAAITAGVCGRDEIMEVIIALDEWNSRRRSRNVGLGGITFGEKPAETVTTQPVSTIPAEKPGVTEKPPTLQEYVNKNRDRYVGYDDVKEAARVAHEEVIDARKYLEKCEQELDEASDVVTYSDAQLPEYQQKVKKAKEALDKAWEAQDEASQELYMMKQISQEFYEKEYAEEFGPSK